MYTIALQFLMISSDEEILKLIMKENKVKEPELKPGSSYLIKERRPFQGFHLFTSLLDRGFHGLHLTRRHPNQIEMGRWAERMRIIWLSTSLGKDYVDPHHLSGLTSIVTTFLSEKEPGAMLLDGLEYLSIYNDYPRLLRFVGALCESAAEKKGIFLLSMNDKAFGPREMSLLERNFESAS